jgi:hypothetical protein
MLPRERLASSRLKSAVVSCEFLLSELSSNRYHARSASGHLRLFASMSSSTPPNMIEGSGVLFGDTRFHD